MERIPQSRWLDLAALVAFLAGGLLIVWRMNEAWPDPFTGFLLVPLAVLVHAVLVRAVHWLLQRGLLRRGLLQRAQWQREQWQRDRQDAPACRVIRLLKCPKSRSGARPWEHAA